MNEKCSTYRRGHFHGRLAVVFCLMLAAALLPVSAFGAPRTNSDVSATYLNSATITLSATGANATFCQLDTKDAVAATSITTGVYGPHVLSFWSTDSSGTVETAIKAPFFVDEDVPPTIVCDARDSYTATASITMTATDNFNGSGVDFVCYRVDGGAYETAVSPASVAATKLLIARMAKVQVAPTAIDPPVDPTLPPPHADRGPCATCHDLIDVTPPEPTSTPGPDVTLSPSVTVGGAGAHTLEYWAQDIARNVTVHVTKSFTIGGQATTLSLRTNHASVTRNHSVVLSGMLKPGLPAGSPVVVQMRKSGSSTWVTLSTRSTSASGAWSYSRKLTSKGKFYFHATFAGSSSFGSNTSQWIAVTVK
jgi:hypothetical protein